MPPADAPITTSDAVSPVFPSRILGRSLVHPIIFHSESYEPILTIEPSPGGVRSFSSAGI
jgi:hypothetical protein